jgi:hypothetical protein
MIASIPIVRRIASVAKEMIVDRFWPRPVSGHYISDVCHKRRSVIHTAVGFALSAFGALEVNLGLLFGVIVGAYNSRYAAERAFGSIRTFEGKKEMLEAAAAAYFLEYEDDDLQAEFNTARKRWREAATFRNEIAHGLVARWRNPAGEILGFTLQPGMWDFRKTNYVGGLEYDVQYSYSAKELRLFGHAFIQLAIEAEDLTDRWSTARC